MSYYDEIVLSYVYVQCRIRDVYGDGEGQPHVGRKKTAKRKKSDTIKEMLGFVVDGVCIYVQTCKDLMKEAFITILSADVFGWVLAIASSVVVFCGAGGGLVRLAVTLIVVRVAYAVVSYTFLEPYETAAMVTTFYNVLYDKEDAEDLEPIKQELLAVSMPFKKLVLKALGREELKGEVRSPSAILDENLLDIATQNLEDAIVEEGMPSGEASE
ncbi:hypothetical protein FACS1894188_11800 [Clostridia bacterium]|nr:hypothetical protein FACS1894188_11800 [Clostridia bacterium]